MDQIDISARWVGLVSAELAAPSGVGSASLGSVGVAVGAASTTGSLVTSGAAGASRSPHASTSLPCHEQGQTKVIGNHKEDQGPCSIVANCAARF